MDALNLDQIRRGYSGKAATEWQRLSSTPITRTEYLITSHCLERYLPQTGLILDAGCGPGRYAIDLMRQNYRVVMFDLVGEMLRLARTKAEKVGIAHEQTIMTQGDISCLPYADNVFDSVISLGAPLSHITERAARLTAIQEMARVVKLRGIVFLTGLTRLAGYRSIVYWPCWELFEAHFGSDFREHGILVGSQVWYAFASGELEQAAQNCGLEIVDRVGCEGLAAHLPLEHLEQVEKHPHYGPLWRSVVLETCNEPGIIGMSNHLLVIARKASRHV